MVVVGWCFHEEVSYGCILFFCLMKGCPGMFLKKVLSSGPLGVCVRFRNWIKKWSKKTSLWEAHTHSQPCPRPTLPTLFYSAATIPSHAIARHASKTLRGSNKRTIPPASAGKASRMHCSLMRKRDSTDQKNISILCSCKGPQNYSSPRTRQQR
jgi:hypothetical protein